ncbi:unnamed protein product [Withania somnifera]
MDKEMDVRNEKVDVPETVVITIRLNEDGETEKSRIDEEEGKGSEGNDVKVKDLKISDDETEKSRVGGEEGKGLEANEIKVKDLKKSEDFSTAIDVKCDGGDGETEKSRIGGEDGDSDVKVNVSEGNVVKVEDLSKSDDFSTVIDVKCDGSDGKVGEDLEGECQRLCRICHLSTYEDEKNLVDLIELGCGCKGELGFVHSHCAEAWFKLKGNRVCEICGEVAQSVTGVSNNRFIEEWNDTRSTASGTGSMETTRGCWHGQPFCNFLMACLVISFVLPWFFRVNMF